VRKNLIGLGVDVPDRTCPALGSSPKRGASEPLVTIVEFSDFECSYCKRSQKLLDGVLARHGGQVALVWKHFPLTHHRQARPAANFALAALAEGGAPRFWKVHDLLFASQPQLDDAAFERIAAQAGLDKVKAQQAVRSGRYDATIQRDLDEGKRLGVRGTPTLFVNGRKISGVPPRSELDQLLREELEWSEKLVNSGTPRHRIYQAICGQPK
jgi:protein-disulfide isomerase